MKLNLSELNLKISYRTGTDDLVKDFYIPCLNRSALYQRAVGYFTSTSLAAAATGIANLIYAGGKIQLIASPELTTEDIDAIERGLSCEYDVINIAAKRSFEVIEDMLVKERLEALAWMVSTGDLEIKLALRTSDSEKLLRGIYHEKIGLFSDSCGNQVAFIGSGNETGSALVDNFEYQEVLWSWDDPHDRVPEKNSIFKELWSNSTNGLKIIDFTEAASEILRPYIPSAPPIPVPVPSDSQGVKPNRPDFPKGLRLRDYQEQAIKNWFDNNGRGSLKMATGSGKTITALSIVTHLYQRKSLKAAIVLCPYKHLVDQWAAEATKFSYNPLIVHTSRNHWSEELNRLLNLQDDENRMLLVITTNQSFSDDFFQRKISFFPQNTVLIADEAHNLGAKDLRTKLPRSVSWRLALSATPERWFDDEGTDVLFNYFGQILKPEFTLQDALNSGALTPYKYYPILVELTEEEQEEYQELSVRIAKLFAGKKADKENTALTSLLIKRARLLAGAGNKLHHLKDLMKTKTASRHWLFYCGDGRVEDPSSQQELRQIESVCRILGRELQMKVDQFTAETPRDKRREIAGKLDSGELQGLVAIRCLDEGVDIPSTEKAVILASSTNPRQFIQRRGRVLRKTDKNPEKVAEIYDMITIPPSDAEISESERSMVKKELVRFVEFANLSLNHGEARKVILELQKKYELLDI